MSSIVIAGDTSGSVTLQAPAVSGSTILTLPATSGTVQTSGAGYTTNGVAFASSTSVLATGSAIVFDGTNLGIGTTAPTNKLQIQTDGTSTTSTIFLGAKNSAGDSVRLLITQDSVGTTTFNSDAGGNGTPGFIFKNTGTEQMRLTSTGLGIGTTSPLAKLTVINTGDANKQVVFGDSAIYYGSVGHNSSTGFNEYRTEPTGGHGFFKGTSATANMTLDSSGNLLVGTTSVVLSGKLTTSFTGNTINGATFDDTGNGNGAGFITFSESGTAIGNISRVSTTSAVAYNTTSDQRLKSNVIDSESVIDKLMQVKVRQYDWTQGAVHQDYGFIAQELKPLLSGIVTEGKTEEDMWQLDYSKLTPHLVKAIQEQQAIIESLKARLDAANL